MELKKILGKVFLTLIVVFIVWISLFGQSVQIKYGSITTVGLVIFLIISFFYKRPNKFSVIDLFLFLYLFSVTLTLPFSENKAIALEWYGRYILPIPLIYLSFKNIDKKDILPIAWGIFISSSLIVIIGLLEAIFRKNIIYELWIENPYYQRFLHQTPRIMSTLMHPTVFGSFLLGCLPFSFFVASRAKKPYKILIKFFIALSILGIIFSFSRGNIVGLIGLAITYLYLTGKRRYIKFVFIGVVILIVFSTIISIVFANIYDYDKYGKFRDPIRNKFGFARFSIGNLLSPWWTADIEKSYITLKILKGHPFLGIGLNHYRLKFDNYSSYNYKQKEERLKKLGSNPYEWRIPDNMYLSILAETGLLAFSSFMLFLFLLFKRAFVLLRRIKDNTENEFLIVCLCAIGGLLINMNTYDLLYWKNPLFLFWFLIGTLRAMQF